MLLERVGESPNVVPIVSVYDGLELNALLSDKFRYGELWSFLFFQNYLFLGATRLTCFTMYPWPTSVELARDIQYHKKKNIDQF